MVFKIKMMSLFHTGDWSQTIGNFIFSAALPLKEADAVVCYWAPSEEFLAFSGPKVFYWSEVVRGAFRPKWWGRVARQLKPTEIVTPNNPNPDFRVPCVTHCIDIALDRSLPRINKGITVISNTSGRPWRRPPSIKLRLRFATAANVDLYGSRRAWESFQEGWFSRKKAPANYKGELDGDWGGDAKLKCTSKYKTEVCLENGYDIYYFTEKFVDAVRAGCIPIYHAHKTVAEGMLKNAAWIDPAEHGFDPVNTVEYALKQDIEKFWDINEKWLASDEVRETSFERVFERIGNILLRKAQTKGKM